MAANEIKIVIGGTAAGIQTAAKQTNAALNSISVSATQVNQNLTKVVPGANQATSAFTALSRGVQDLPFGAAGFANNIEGIIGGFRGVVKESGSVRAAFSALGASLIGGGGLMLAVGAVSTAMSVFSMTSRGAKEELEGFAKAMDESNKKAGDEIARVQILNAVITDNTRTQTERGAASKELSGILDDLNIKLSAEEILNGKVADATKLATAAIIERAKARAAEARIGELSGQQLERDTKRIAITEKLTNAQKALAAAQAANQAAVGGGTVPGIRGNTIGAQNQVTSLQNDIAALDKQTQEANKEIERLIGLIKTNDLTIDFSGGGDKGKKDLDLLRQRIEALKQLQSLTGLTTAQQVELAQLEIQLSKRDAVKLGFTDAELSQQIEGILEKSFPVATFEFDLEAKPKIDAKALTDGFSTDIAAATGNQVIEVPAPQFVFKDTVGQAEKATLQLFESLRNTISNGVTDFGESIGEALAAGSFGDGLKAAAGSILNTLGSVMQQLGKYVISAAIKLEILKKTLEKFAIKNPALAIVAGIALVAGGAALKNIKFDVPKFAEGGIATGATLGIFGERGREAIIPLDKLPQMMGKMNFANETPVVLQPSIRFSLSDFQIGLERVDNRRRRLG